MRAVFDWCLAGYISVIDSESVVLIYATQTRHHLPHLQHISLGSSGSESPCFRRMRAKAIILDCKQETDFKRGMSHYGKSNMALETHSAIDGEVV